MMKRSLISFKPLYIAIIFAVCTVVSPFHVQQTQAVLCSDCQDTAIPPFIDTSTGHTPNLLLLIDNSASMYDLAFPGEYQGPSSPPDVYTCDNGSPCDPNNNQCASICATPRCANWNECTPDPDPNVTNECERIDIANPLCIVMTCENGVLCDPANPQDCLDACAGNAQCANGDSCIPDPSVDDECQNVCVDSVYGYCDTNPSTVCELSGNNASSGKNNDCKKPDGWCLPNDECAGNYDCSGDAPCTVNTCTFLKDQCIDEEGNANYDCTADNNLCTDTYCDAEPVSTNDTPCIDNSFNTGKTYTGYFEPLEWYTYDTNSNYFEITANTNVGDYHNDDVHIFSSGNDVTDFRATGNFLNWATASKFDVEKKILAGGRYDDTNDWLESEGRGCSGNIYIKQIAVDAKYFTLGVRANKANATGSGNYEATLIDILPLSANPFDPLSCQLLVEELNKGWHSKLPKVRTYLSGCLNDPNETNKLYHFPAHDCWWSNKHQKDPHQRYPYDDACKDYYISLGNKQPYEVMPYNICFGDSRDAVIDGFIGECWDTVAYDWKDANKKTREACMFEARARYCEFMFDYQGGADPSDLDTSGTGTVVEAPNTSPFFMNLGVYGQMGEPTATYEVRIKPPAVPAGLLQDYADKINIGAMAFNRYGSDSECSQPNMEAYGCGSMAPNKDGSYLIQPIAAGDLPDPITGVLHKQSLIDSINSVKATETWTPLAEAMFNAIGYYTLRSAFRINAPETQVSESMRRKLRSIQSLA